MNDYNRLQIGDRLVRTKGGILSKHPAIYAGNNFNTNQNLVAENQVASRLWSKGYYSKSVFKGR